MFDIMKVLMMGLCPNVMSAFGTEGFSVLKIWMIKHYRDTTRIGLADSKHAVERVSVKV